MVSEATRKLKASGMLADFVRRKNGAWNHADWMDFLRSVRMAGHSALPDHEVGRLLEEEKARFWAARTAGAGRARTETPTVDATRGRVPR